MSLKLKKIDSILIPLIMLFQYLLLGIASGIKKIFTGKPLYFPEEEEET